MPNEARFARAEKTVGDDRGKDAAHRSAVLQYQRQPCGNKHDAVGEYRNFLVEAAGGIPELPSKRRLRNEAHSDLVGDQHDRARGQP